MSSQGWRCHNDAPVVVTIVDASDVKTSEVESAATTRFYNCEVRAAPASPRQLERARSYYRLTVRGGGREKYN